MHVLEDLSYTLEDMLEPLSKKQDISPTELDNIYKAVKTMNYIETIKAMNEYGNSNDGSYNSYAGGSYGRYSRYSYPTSFDGRYGMDGDGDGRYSERGNSRARNSRESYRRYSRDGYSGDAKEEMIAKLERKMDMANSETERQTIRDMIREIENER